MKTENFKRCLPSALRTASLTVAVTTALAGRLASAQTPGDWTTVTKYQEVAGFASKGNKIAVRPDGVIFNIGWIWLDAGGSYGAAVRASTDSGRTWQTQSINTTAGWTGTEYNALTFDPAGCLVTACEIWDPNPNNHKNWIVQRSCDSGASFSWIDSYQEGHCPSAQDIAFSANGDLYVAGWARSFDEPSVWAVRKSSDGGATWATVDLQGTEGSNDAMAIACQPNGNIFVGGHMSYLSKRVAIDRWIVKRSVNRGQTWTIVDTFQESSNCRSGVTASTVDQAGNVYVAGWADNVGKRSGFTDWIVRRSADNGITWTVVDSFTLATGHALSPLAMTVDPSGNLWVCGYTEPNDGIYPMHWIVRKGTRSANGALTWAEVDNYQLANGQHARANGITSDAAGNIYVSGRANDATGSTFWIVRKLAADKAK
jgi:hypothetical protein